MVLVEVAKKVWVDTDRSCMYCNIILVRSEPGLVARAKFCNKSCHAKYQLSKGVLHRKRGDNPGRTYLRREVVKYFNGEKCAICGWYESSCDVAHIVAVKDNGANLVDNTILLCPNHHRMFDRGLLSVEEVLAARKKALIEQEYDVYDTELLRV